MTTCDMHQSNFDPCLFVEEKVMCIAYVDDMILWARDEDDIHDLVMQLRDLGVDLEQEDDVSGFLGVTLEHDESTDLM